MGRTYPQRQVMQQESQELVRPWEGSSGLTGAGWARGRKRASANQDRDLRVAVKVHVVVPGRKPLTKVLETSRVPKATALDSVLAPVQLHWACAWEQSWKGGTCETATERAAQRLACVGQSG